MRRLRYLLISPRTPQRIAQGTTALGALGLTTGAIVAVGTGWVSHLFAAGLVDVAGVLAQ